MSTSLVDVLRIIALLFVATATAQMFVINFRTWRNRTLAAPPPRLLWIHVLIISARDLLLTIWVTYEVMSRIGQGATWRLVMLLIVGMMGNAAFFAVGKVIATRRTVSEAVEGVFKSHDGN